MVIGIAGGVGSGKSTVLNILKSDYDVRICMADELGHRALERGTGVYDRVVERFGGAVLSPDGEVDRRALAKIVYRDETRLEELNGIVHPYVREEIQRQIEGCPARKVFVLETAILFESGCGELCDEVWGVITEDEIRIRRLTESRGYSRERAESIMRQQMRNRELAQRCDRIVVNDGDMEELARHIHKCMEQIENVL